MLTTLSYQHRLTGAPKAHHQRVPITPSEIAKEAFTLRRSTFLYSQRAHILSQHFYQYTGLEQLKLFAQFSFDPAAADLPVLLSQWKDLFQEALPSADPALFTQWWTYLRQDRQLLSLISSPQLSLLSPGPHRLYMLRAIRSLLGPFHTDSFDVLALAHKIAKRALPLLQSNIDASFADLFQSTAVEAYAQSSLFTKEGAALSSPLWLALVARASDPLLQIQILNNTSWIPIPSALENVQQQLLASHDLLCDHFLRIIESLSKPEVALTTFDKIQINTFLQKHSPAACTLADLEESAFDLDTLLAYLEAHGLKLDLKDEESTLYSWFRPFVTTGALVATATEDVGSRIADKAEDSLTELIPKALSHGGSKFVKYLPSIAIGLVTLAALLGPKRKAEKKWSIPFEEQVRHVPKHSTSLKLFVTEHFARFIVACALYSHESALPLPSAIAPYKDAIFSRNDSASYALSHSLCLELPSWSQIQELTPFPLPWLRHLTRHCEDPIAWAIDTLNNHDPQTPVLTSRELDLEINRLEKLWLHSARTQIHLWKHALLKGPPPPILDLPHLSKDLLPPLLTELQFLFEPRFKEIALQCLAPALNKLLRAHAIEWSQLLSARHSSPPLALSLHPLKVAQWPQYFRSNPAQWLACFKALSLPQWTSLLRDLQRDRTSWDPCAKFLYNTLLTAALSEQRFPQSDPLLSKKLALWPLLSRRGITDVDFSKLIYNQQYELALSLYGSHVLWCHLREEHLWQLFANHGQWPLLQSLNFSSSPRPSDQEMFEKGLSSQNALMTDRIDRRFIATTSLSRRSAYVAQTLLWGRWSLLSDLLENAAEDLLGRLANPPILQALLRQIHRSSFSPHKKWKLEFALLGYLWPNLDLARKNSHAWILFRKALSLRSLFYIQKLNHIAFLDLLSHPDRLHRSRWNLFSPALATPFDNIFQALIQITPSPFTVTVMSFFTESYFPRPQERLQKMKEYFKATRSLWPVGRKECRKTMEALLTPAFTEVLALNPVKWLRWAIEHDSPFVVRLILKTQPYHPSWWNRDLSLEHLCQWISSHLYIDIFSKWAQAQTLSEGQALGMLIAALRQKKSSLVLFSTQKLQQTPLGESLLDALQTQQAPRSSQALLLSQSRNVQEQPERPPIAPRSTWLCSAL